MSEPKVSLDDFTLWTPSSVYFNELIKVKSLKDWEFERKDNYWIAESPFYEDGLDRFRDFVGQSPVWRTNSEKIFKENNPFATIHLPTWATHDVCQLLRDFFVAECGASFHNYHYEEWGNIFDRNYCKPLKRWRIPHMDWPKGIVGNLWFDGGDSTGTKLYRYKRNVNVTQMEFHYNPELPQHQKWISYADDDRADEWFNFEDSDYWEFEEIDFAPAKTGTMTLYRSNTAHDPFITPQTNFRWSHTFCCFADHVS